MVLPSGVAQKNLKSHMWCHLVDTYKVTAHVVVACAVGLAPPKVTSVYSKEDKSSNHYIVPLSYFIIWGTV